MIKKKVGLLMGGNSDEREVSLMSAKQILEKIDYEKYILIPIEVSRDNINWINILMDLRPDIVLSALHGGAGENGSVQGLLECLKIPYVGSGVLGSALAMDKFISKTLMRSCHIPVADDVLIRRKENITAYENCVRRLGFPLVVKPNKGGSSVGVRIVKTLNEVWSATEKIWCYDDALIEKYIEGQEVTCGVLETEKGLTVLTVLDIDTDSADSFFDYNSKYFNRQTKIEFSNLPSFLQVMIQEVAKKVFRILECSGYGRVDMIVKDEQIYVLEMNTLPGLTAHSLIPKAAEGVGMDFSSFLDHLISSRLLISP